MIILFPRRKGVKIATRLTFEAMEQRQEPQFIQGMIYFAAAFGAITKAERASLIQYLNTNKD